MSAVATIDLAAYRANIALVRERIRPARLMVMVKADAYGHGLLPVAAAAVDAGIDLIGVLDTASGLALRSAGVEAQLFAWLFAPDEHFEHLIGSRIDLGTSRRDELERIAVAASAVGVAARVHLKIDTGLHRNGASLEEWPSLVARALELERQGRVRLEGVWTHIGEASDAEDSLAIAAFEQAVAEAESLGARIPLLHLAASAAGFERVDARFDAVRVGAFTYGIAPGSGIGPAGLGLTPVMTMTGEVISVTGGAVDSRGLQPSLATVSVGYLDGVPVQAARRVEAAVNGTRYPIVAVHAGSLDLEIDDAVHRGDVVTLFGPGSAGEATLQEWADALGTIGEELVVRIPAAVPRVYRG